MVSAPRSRATAAICSTGFSTPVDVSAWTTVTMSAGRLQREGLAHGVGIDCAAPVVRVRRVTCAPYRSLIWAIRSAKYPPTSDNTRVFVADQIRHGRFHGRGARARHGETKRALWCPEVACQPPAKLVHHGHQIRVQMTEHGRGHSPHHARRDHAGTGTEQNSFQPGRGIMEPSKSVVSSQ